jgi:hypothetical protein
LIEAWEKTGRIHGPAGLADYFRFRSLRVILRVLNASGGIKASEIPLPQPHCLLSSLVIVPFTITFTI